MKKQFVAALAVTALAFTMFPAAVMAEPAADVNTQTTVALAGATEMTDTEMDQVTAGALLNVTVAGNNILDNNRVGVQAAVNAAIGVLGNAAAVQHAAASLTQ